MKSKLVLNTLGQNALVEWFQHHQRPLPWRKNRDPYRIWISETMLQQTTSTAVKPYFERFLKKFPRLQDLARASQEDVYSVWAGLGYYSRARNLLKAARQLSELKTWPETHKEWIQYPGLGPYTARAVSSLAFGERVGVLDGNVIRVLSRLGNQKVEWWNPKQRSQLQSQADALNETQDPYLINQALMELGATVCLPKNPSCLICPIHEHCRALKAGTVFKLPLRKPKKPKEIWIWQPQVLQRSGKLAFIKDDKLPFLKNHWVLPGTARRLMHKPRTFDLKHNITHHEIYVTLSSNPRKLYSSSSKELRWFSSEEIQGQIPASLIHKVLRHWQKSSL